MTLGDWVVLGVLIAVGALFWLGRKRGIARNNANLASAYNLGYHRHATEVSHSATQVVSVAQNADPAVAELIRALAIPSDPGAELTGAALRAELFAARLEAQRRSLSSGPFTGGGDHVRQLAANHDNDDHRS